MVLLTGFEPATYSLSNCNVYRLRHRSMARVLGLEPRITESKSVVLPLHYTRTKIKQDEASKPGLEPTTHPQAGRPAKSGCRKRFAVFILKLVCVTGFEPASGGCYASCNDALTFILNTHKMVPLTGFEPVLDNV